MQHDLLEALLQLGPDFSTLYLTNQFFKHTMDTIVAGAPSFVESIAEGAVNQKNHINEMVEAIRNPKAGHVRNF